MSPDIHSFLKNTYDFFTLSSRFLHTPLFLYLPMSSLTNQPVIIMTNFPPIVESALASMSQELRAGCGKSARPVRRAGEGKRTWGSRTELRRESDGQCTVP